MDESWLPEAMKALRSAVAATGGQAPFERKTGLKQQTISHRLRNDIPLQGSEEVLAVEAALADLGQPVTRHDLRPDIYPRDKCHDPACPEHGRASHPSAVRADTPPPADDPSTGGGDRTALEGVRS